MSIAGIIFILIILLVVYLLLTPILISVDTSEMKFQLKMVGVIMVWPEFSETLWIHIKIPFKQLRIDILKRSEKDKRSPKRNDTTTKGSERSLSLRRVRRVISSFELRYFLLDVDTDNYKLNGQLFPAFWWLSKNGLNCNINFTGNNRLAFELRNNLLRAGFAWFKGT